jgi:putative spermidine/putrescine transport system substrate-binding protein
MSHAFQSRTLRRGLIAAAAITALFGSGFASAQTKTLYIGMNGGTMEKAYTQYVFPAFEKLNNVKVVVVRRPTFWPRLRPTRTSHRCM